MKKYIVFFFCAIVSSYAWAKLQATSFPKTYEDLSFAARMANMTDGYKPFMDKKAYTELNIVPKEEIFTDRLIASEIAAERERIDNEKYCRTHPEDKVRCPEKSQLDKYGNQYFANIGGGAVTEDNFVTGASCYPAAKDAHYPNKIFTTARYENISPAFEKAMITIFRKEGKCGTIKGDPCGYTCYGIGSSPKCAGVVIKTRPEAEDWYYENYWQKYNICKLQDVISTDYFLAAMASGPGTAFNQFRTFLGLSTASGAKITDDMVYAVNNYNGDIHNNWMNKRDVFLQQVADKYQREQNVDIHQGYKNAIEIKRKNGCHVRPNEPLYRN